MRHRGTSRQSAGEFRHTERQITVTCHHGRARGQQRGRAMAWAWILCAALPLIMVPPETAAGQDNVRRQLRQSQLRLQQIRSERQTLQRALEELRTRVHGVRAELDNIERQSQTSAEMLRELDFQTAVISASIDSTLRYLVGTRDRLTASRAVLRHRLRVIYKRGPLHTLRVLFGARSFADLLNRYKYLRMVANSDHLLVEQVERLASELQRQETQLQRNLRQLERLRADQLAEFARLHALERQHQRMLSRIRERERQTAGQIEQLAATEKELSGLIARLEQERREAERRRLVSGEPEAATSMSTSDLGALAWPVAGRLIYRFGPDHRDGGITLRWNGIGIGAPAGRAVRAVSAGTVVTAEPFEGYGPTVIVSHGGGYYTTYHYLEAIRVREGDRIEAGRVIGTVGGEDTPEGAHIEFQVHAPVNGGYPEPVDPLEWLRAQQDR